MFRWEDILTPKNELGNAEGDTKTFLRRKNQPRYIFQEVPFVRIPLASQRSYTAEASEHERDFSHEAQNRPKGMGSKKSQWGENYESLEFEKKLCDAKEGKRLPKQIRTLCFLEGYKKFFFFLNVSTIGRIHSWHVRSSFVCQHQIFSLFKRGPTLFPPFLRPIDASHLPKTCPHALSRFRKRNFQRSDSIIYPDRLQKGYKLSHFKRGPQPAISRGVNVRSVCLKRGKNGSEDNTSQAHTRGICPKVKTFQI